MSDDLVSKMRQAADAAIATSKPAEDAPVEALAAPEEAEAEAEVEKPEGEQPAQAEEPSPETDEEPAPDTAQAKPEDEDEFFLIRKQAERRVSKAEARAKELEAKLTAATEEADRSRKAVAEDIFKKLRRKPIATFKEFGLDFQDLIDAGLRETHGQDDRVVSEIDELRAELRELKEERKANKEREEEAQLERQYQEARNTFLNMVTKKDFPTLYNMFEDDPDALWVEAQRVAEKISASDEDSVEDLDVIKMLEEKYRARLKRLGGGVAPVEGKKPAPKTLNTKAASEVRTTGKPFGQLDASEQKAALLAAVKKATSHPSN